MLAVWECRLGNQAPTGSCLAPTFSFGIPPTISRRLLSAFETRIIHKPTILQHVTSYDPHRSKRCLKHVPGWSCDEGECIKITCRSGSHKSAAPGSAV